MLQPRKTFGNWFTTRFVPVVFPRINPLTVRLLKSPLHPALSWYVVLLRFRGMRTGRSYEVPVSYHRVGQGCIEAVTSPAGRWWRNLRSAGGITVLLKGRERAAKVDVITDDLDAIAAALRRRDPCRRLLVAIPPDQTVLIRFRLMD